MSTTNGNREKHELRQRIRARVASVPAETRRELSTVVVARLGQMPEWQCAQFILGYLPLKDELDLSPALNAALRAGKTVALPRYLPAEGHYCAALLSSGENIADLPSGQFGVLEPAADAPVLPLNQLDFVLVPGVGFDPGGRRLGRGKGFYDRLLAETNSLMCVKCGVALDEQIVPAIPHEPHDVVMNLILTPTRWIEVPAAST